MGLPILCVRVAACLEVFHMPDKRRNRKSVDFSSFRLRDATYQELVTIRLLVRRTRFKSVKSTPRCKKLV